MLRAPVYLPPTELDQLIFDATVPADHYLRRVLLAVDFQRCRPLLAPAYDPDRGRPALEPVLLLKLEFLQYQYGLSDRAVVDQAHYNMAFRLFLGLSLHSGLPDPSLLSYFRRRLGPQRHQQVFDDVVGQAREKGLVKDRLRLKDATHVIANIAIPTAIALVARTRGRLLQALAPWAGEEVQRQRQHAEQVRHGTADLGGQERLLQRVAHLRELVAWAQGVCGGAPFTEAPPVEQEPLRQALALAGKVLADRDDPEAKDALRSVQDPDARRGKHGRYYDGYLLDVAMDADSRIITALNVLPGNADEAADAVTLLRQEEQAHGNDVQAISMDSAGFRGALLHTLTDPAGLHVDVVVPPRAPTRAQEVQPEQFTLSADRRSLTCPAGQTATARRRHARDGCQFRFPRALCAACPLQSRCVPRLPRTCGRTVFKSDYEADLLAARAKAQTPAYQQVRREHPAVERKIAELVRRHGARQARYWGQPRVRMQQLLTGWVVNIKRMVHLLGGLRPRPAGVVRAELVASG